MTKRADRLLEWCPPTSDPPPPRAVRVTDPRALARLLVRHASGPLRVQFVYSDPELFQPFCRLAYAWCEAGAAAGRVSVLVVEEAANVTHQGKARDWWALLLRQGKHIGCELFALTQSPAEIDNTTRRNVNCWHVGRLSTHADRLRISRDAGISLTALESLHPLEYLEAFDHSPGFVNAGRL